MNERLKKISRLIESRTLRESYIRSKLGVLLPAQIRSLRLRRQKTQAQLGEEADMKQARISALERIGEGNFSVETLIRLAAAFGVGLVVKFVPFSEMLKWENSFEPDLFDVVPVDKDQKFLYGEVPPLRLYCSSRITSGVPFESLLHSPGNKITYFSKPVESGLPISPTQLLEQPQILNADLMQN